MRALICLFCLMLLGLPAAAECRQPALRIAVIPKKSMEVLMQDYQPLLERLHKALGVPVSIVPASSYESVVDAVVSGGVDVAWLGPAAYVLAQQRDPSIEPFAVLAIRKGYFTPAGHHYQALLLARRGVAEDLESLRGTRVALSDPASTSGSVVPNVEFAARVGQPLARFFGSVAYSGSHDKSLDALLEGRVDAAFVASVRADAYLNSGRIARDTFNVLWRSERIYYDPYVFRGNLCAGYKARIRAAMLENQEGLAAFLASQDASAIAPVGRAEYAPLVRMMETR
ncbi:phosphate/phosphite/phosphonate ABC transporter substrate-binding protein [Pseudomonas sp. 148P]|uniref:Phosphate/phosphite/phosphonate ABC transporter substrate-binding protein n=1 Tax=Pseudomonas ulcerans TaxID=3115852 RepID=A0ABU7HYF7_9PSED|nr:MULTISPECIES: phosphate/phosphite/phosphonate ABC transporter substrate-binding protein [unclassified Pseudomonas]MEE1925147.1 phosphate/phosphite/phosphonate ABC transporter substrate-binding protein [Pseudomonas sp. 147P]MEE1936574.1 phosphate/phosphite/phosphonate ABC transporter substrate-binding protein [Pseudomonas sp. 148P]